ncbi:MAG: ECF-type sigma factor [Candidatus Eisenbacteria bacterium]
MDEPIEGEVTRLLRLIAKEQEDPSVATAKLFQATYRELHRIAVGLMSHERQSHTLQPTALVNEAYLRLVGDVPIEWESRAQFFGIVASAMRRVLIQHARRRAAEKRGGGCEKIALDEHVQIGGRSELEILELDRILSRFAEVDPRAAQIVEMRVFAGLREKEIATVLGVSERTVRGDWRIAAAWLGRELRGPPGGPQA